MPYGGSMAKVVFFERDGIINEKPPEDRCVTCWEEFHFIPDVFQTLKYIKSRGYLTILVTNQRGIARKLMTEEQLLKVHEQMQCVLKWHNGSFDKIFFCPHDIDDNCTCRKPKPGLLTMAEQYYKIDKTQSYIVSGSAGNLEAGRRYGIKTIRVGSWDATADYSVGKLADILNIVV